MRCRGRPVASRFMCVRHVAWCKACRVSPMWRAGPRFRTAALASAISATARVSGPILHLKPLPDTAPLIPSGTVWTWVQTEAVLSLRCKKWPPVSKLTRWSRMNGYLMIIRAMKISRSSINASRRLNCHPLPMTWFIIAIRLSMRLTP